MAYKLLTPNSSIAVEENQDPSQHFAHATIIENCEMIRFKYPLTYYILNLLVAQWRSENM